MSSLKIYRASAGSGKTFTLTQEYIKLLFKNETDYKHILAVTFTNKATAEMRTRILESLYSLSDAECANPEHLKELCHDCNISPSEVRTKAARMLGKLLHDYSRFSVSTIDSFFQRIIRSFARETGLSTGFRLELQSDKIMMQAIDRVILEMNRPEHADLKQWLIEFAETKMEQEQGWNITREIKNVSEAIYSETYQANSLMLAEKLADKKGLRVYRDTLRSIISNTDKWLSEIGRKALQIIENRGLDILDDFNGKSRTKVKIFMKMNTLKEFAGETSYSELIDNPDKWVRKGSGKESAVLNAYHSGLNNLLHQANAMMINQSGNYFTAQAILENLNALGIVNDVSTRMNELSREYNMFLISGTNHLLNRIINGNETPFLYEKTGVRYSHFMIDEFQDTSALQYANFKPLINESLAAENCTLLVGDIKQAIYRWRNSDWSLLGDAVERDFTGYGTSVSVLDTNWRSLENIIRFNNDFFSEAPHLLQTSFNGMIPEPFRNTERFAPLEHKIESVYADVLQKVSAGKQRSGGSIFIRFTEGGKSETKEDLIAQSVARIVELTETCRLSDICILVRKNSEGIAMTNALLSGKYHPQAKSLPVISSEALLLSGSEAVKSVVAKLKLLQNPDDSITESYIRLAWLNQLCADNDELDVASFSDQSKTTEWELHKEKLFALRQLPLYELVEALVAMLPAAEKRKSSVHLQTFLSAVSGFISQESASPEQFLNYWDINSEKLSLSIPENQEAIRVMTIHKSKGLEFKAVVLPFFNWDIKDSAILKKMLWVTPPVEPFNYLSLVPVTSRKELVYSFFSHEYLMEIMQQYVDNLNLAYVAFTRARESLSVFANIRNCEINEIQTVADVLQLFVHNPKHAQFWNGGDLTFVKGEHLNDDTTAKTAKTKKRREEEIEIGDFRSFAFRNRITVHLEGDDYIDDEQGSEKRTYGKIMHRLFENIVTATDVEPALKELRNKGIITPDEQHELMLVTTGRLNHPDVKKWFDGSYTVKTEASIISADEKRPDRVMFSTNEVIVADYKFGNTKSAHHHRQVREYIRLLKAMGYTNVTGYLWYVMLEDVERVGE
ncbi:MAG: UvrD-helicase domain-containing protein [Cytophagaceae bacterium]|jgi:ATP-dependent exoDNAse (exonuclease V) beta subunit|nr:UvrD-helicase domain-containing protein [Cytophagaceae bacterium]